MMMTRKRLLAKLLYTASCWHGDTGKGPVAMLSLSSTRKVHSEEHRRRLIDEIVCDICVSIGAAQCGHAISSNLEEIRELTLLWEEVASCKVGEEWLTDRENLRYGDELYEKGLLRKSED
jgi:hypothetical protein